MGKTRLIQLPWPGSGVREITAIVDNPSQFTLLARNMRTFEPSTDRARGAKRPGLADLVTVAESGDIQHIAQVIGDNNVPAVVVGSDTSFVDDGVAADPGIIAAATF